MEIENRIVGKKVMKLDELLDRLLYSFSNFFEKKEIFENLSNVKINGFDVKSKGLIYCLYRILANYKLDSADLFIFKNLFESFFSSLDTPDNIPSLSDIPMDEKFYLLKFSRLLKNTLINEKITKVLRELSEELLRIDEKSEKQIDEKKILSKKRILEMISKLIPKDNYKLPKDNPKLPKDDSELPKDDSGLLKDDLKECRSLISRCLRIYFSKNDDFKEKEHEFDMLIENFIESIYNLNLGEDEIYEQNFYLVRNIFSLIDIREKESLNKLFYPLLGNLQEMENSYIIDDKENSFKFIDWSDGMISKLFFKHQLSDNSDNFNLEEEREIFKFRDLLKKEIRGEFVFHARELDPDFMIIEDKVFSIVEDRPRIKEEIEEIYLSWFNQFNIMTGQIN